VTLFFFLLSFFLLLLFLLAVLPILFLNLLVHTQDQVIDLVKELEIEL